MPFAPAFVEGARACLPVLPGVMSFGAITGVAMIGAGLSVWSSAAMSVLVFAGTSQLAALQLAAVGAPLAVIYLAALVLNLRFVLYSISVAPHLAGVGGLPRVFLAYSLSDNGYAHFVSRYAGHQDDRGKGEYLLGACAAIWVAWQAGTAAGIALGASIPSGWALEFTVALTFLALWVSTIRDRALAAAAIASAVVAVLAYPLPFRAGLLLATAAGIAVGVATDRWTR